MRLAWDKPSLAIVPVVLKLIVTNLVFSIVEDIITRAGGNI